MLKPGGLLLLTVPDLQQVAELVAATGLEEEAYMLAERAGYAARHDLWTHALAGARPSALWRTRPASPGNHFQIC